MRCERAVALRVIYLRDLRKLLCESRMRSCMLPILHTYVRIRDSETEMNLFSSDSMLQQLRPLTAILSSRQFSFHLIFILYYTKILRWSKWFRAVFATL